MKKLFTIACTLVLGGALSFAQAGGTTGGQTTGQTGTTSTDTGKTGKKHHKGHKGGKKSKKNSGSSTTTPPPK